MKPRLQGILGTRIRTSRSVNKKTDVYSFGILVLEVISGGSSSRAAFTDELLVLVEWVWKLREEGRLLECLDPYLTKFPQEEVIRFIKVALFCTQAAAQKRPNMKQVVEMLSRKEINLNEAALTEPDVYRGVNKGRNHRGLGLRGGSSEESSSTQRYKGQSSAAPQGSSSASVITFQSITEMAPR